MLIAHDGKVTSGRCCTTTVVYISIIIIIMLCVFDSEEITDLLQVPRRLRYKPPTVIDGISHSRRYNNNDIIIGIVFFLKSKSSV